MKRRRVMEALTISLSASMLLNPIVAFAGDSSEDVSEFAETKEDTNKDDTDTAVPDHESVEQQLDDTATELITVNGQVGEADKHEDTDYSETEEALDKSVDGIRDAAKDIQKSDAAVDREINEAAIIDEETSKVEDNVLSADKAFSDAEEAALEAIKKEEAIDADKATEIEAKKAVADITEDIKEANDKLNEAYGNLSKAQAAFDIADREYKALLTDDSISDEALNDAKEKVADAESVLIVAKKNVDENAEIAGELEKKANKLAVYNQINELQNEIEAMSSEDKGYEEKVNRVSELIVRYYLFDEIDEGTDLVIGDDHEEFVIDYERNEKGDLYPVKKSIGYKTVTYIADGQDVTKKIEYSYDEKGNITISEKSISAIESEKPFLPQTILTNEKGEEYTATETSHVIYMDEDDEEVGFYAIDTKSSKIISEIGQDRLLPKPGDSVTSLNEEYNEVTTIYNSITPVDRSPAAVTYEITEEGIAEVASKRFEVEYTLITNYVETDSGYTRKNAVYEAVDARVEELKAQYGDNVTIVKIRYSTTTTGSAYSLQYKVEEKKNDVMDLPVSKTIYKSEEYCDRNGTQKYVDEKGKEYAEKKNSIVVYKDSENKKLGYYASDGKYVLYLYEGPESLISYERDEYGRDIKTVVYYSPARGTRKTVSMESVPIIRYGKIETTTRTLSDEESLYDVLNEYRKKQTVGVYLRGEKTDEFDYGLNLTVPGWYDIAEEQYALIMEKAGGCYLELSDQPQTTTFFTGIIEKEIDRRTVTTDVYLTDSIAGSSESKEEAGETLEAIQAELKSKYKLLHVEDIKLSEEITEDGESAWNYSIKYQYLYSQNIENVDTVGDVHGYRFKEYNNSEMQMLKVYDVSEDDATLVSTDDDAFKDAISQKSKAYSNAVTARENVNKATKSYEEALESVKRAKEAVNSLTDAGVTKAIISDAKNKYEEAKKKLDEALKNKEAAEQAYSKAKESLTSAEKKLALIQEKSAAGKSEEASGAGSSTANENAQTNVAPNEENVYTASSTTTEQSGIGTSQSQEAVLGAVRENETKAVTSNSATQDSIDEINEESSEDSSKINDISDKETTSDENSILKKIMEEKPALAPTITPPAENSKHYLIRMLLALVVMAGMIVAWIASSGIKEKER